jgi:hypothetical protein
MVINAARGPSGSRRKPAHERAHDGRAGWPANGIARPGGRVMVRRASQRPLRRGIGAAWHQRGHGQRRSGGRCSRKSRGPARRYAAFDWRSRCQNASMIWKSIELMRASGCVPAFTPSPKGQYHGTGLVRGRASNRANFRSKVTETISLINRETGRALDLTVRTSPSFDEVTG